MSEWQKLRKGRMEYGLNAFVRFKARLFTALLSRQFGSCGKRVTVCPPLRFANARCMHLGEGVIIHRDCWIHVLLSENSAEQPKLVIDSFAGIGMGSTLSAAKEVVLGKHVMLARNVFISDHGHAFEDVNEPVSTQGIRDVRPVHIDDDTWLGQNVCVMPGVRIGRHCVIGANSVVTRDVPSFSVVVGAPAKVVRRYDPERKQWERVSS